MAKEESAYKVLTNCPSCILSLEKGLELMQESGEPMEFGIFDYSEVFSRAFAEGGEWGSGDLNESTRHREDAQDFKFHSKLRLTVCDRYIHPQ